MDRPFDIVTFDCYGTLVDWEQGIGLALAAMARSAGAALDLPSALRAYHEIEPAVQAERFRSYRDVLGETARRLAARLGWHLDGARASGLADSLPSWPAFPDTNPALERLHRAGYRLGILSNVDDDLLAGTRRQFTVPFDLIVTAEQVRAYKPARAHFERAREHIGAARWLHAAQSYVHDVIPARACGIPVAWINRKAEAATDGGAPSRELRTLADLADWLAPRP
jgi:2-haloalkanoic acid dehalogenase type II